MAIQKKINDLREWLNMVEEKGELKIIEGADWNLEIGAISELQRRMENPPVFLFDKIKDYIPGYRVVTGSLLTPSRLGLTFGFPTSYSEEELTKNLKEKLRHWEKEARGDKFGPEIVDKGPVKENVYHGKNVDISKFPAPFWHEYDGGCYIGTGCVVITKDPDTGWINLGTYRVMVVDKKTLTINIAVGHHGRIHLQKWHERDLPCPIAVSVGHDPLLFALSAVEVPFGLSEYNYTGATKGEPIRVIEGEMTGLPIPADSEIVLEGWIPPNEIRDEGPFGEWRGYYSNQIKNPIIKVEALYHRDNPIILGSPPGRPVNDFTLLKMVVRSAMLHNALEDAGVPDVTGVWTPTPGDARLLRVVSIKQRFPGHAKQAGVLTAQIGVGGYEARYVVVVDDDVNIYDINDVFWAVCTRADPEKSIDILRRTWGDKTDQLHYYDPTNPGLTSIAIIDATRPYEHIDKAPKVCGTSKELLDKVRDKFKNQLIK